MAAATQILGLLAALIITGVSAATLLESRLVCSPREVEPTTNITCFIYVRDELLEPTAQFTESAFLVKVLTEVPEVAARVSSVERTADPTVARFVVSAPKGTSVRIDVEVRASGQLIRGSGFVATVLTWPPTSLGEIACDAEELALRATTTCTAPAVGANNVPAIVRAGDVFLSEDHSEGAFHFVSGVRALTFNFSAPNFLGMAFNDFIIRATITGSAEVRTARLPVIVPPLPPTERSVLKCAADAADMCFVNAADSVGPVRLRPADFEVRVEELDAEGLQWLDVTDSMRVRWEPTRNQGSSKLIVEQRMHTRVFSARLLVACRASGTGRPLPLIGSPFRFRSGVPPTPQYASLRGCSHVFMTALDTTTCTIDIASSITPDTRYFSLDVSSATGVGGDLGGLELVNASSPSAGLHFRFTAGDVTERATVFLTASVGGEQIAQSPWKLVVYPRESGTSVRVEEGSSRGAKIAIGVCFFGSVLVTGAVLLCRHRRRIAHARKAHHPPQEPPVPVELGEHVGATGAVEAHQPQGAEIPRVALGAPPPKESVERR